MCLKEDWLLTPGERVSLELVEGEPIGIGGAALLLARGPATGIGGAALLLAGAWRASASIGVQCRMNPSAEWPADNKRSDDAFDKAYTVSVVLIDLLCRSSGLQAVQE